MAMEEEVSEVGYEVREELMVPPTGDAIPILRVSHFLKPTINSMVDDGSVFELPSHCLSSLPPTFEPNNWPLKVTFNGFRFPQRNWEKWVTKMASLHEHTWKKAGIHEAILSSTYKIKRNHDLILALAEKWCPETKSFIFAWGETTITLEDLMILGFSVLGSPAFKPLKTDELKNIEDILNQARKELMFSASGKAEHSLWLKKFMDTGSIVEHEAFLSLWLSRFVFPYSCRVITNTITSSVFSIAIHLARGTRIALAPAILASIYRDLSLLKQKIVSLTKLDSDKLAITIRSQFQFVQIWAWERFIELRPKRNLIQTGEPRISQWHGTMKVVDNVRMVLDSAKESFDWRPYCRTLKNWSFPKFYGEKEMWVSVGADSCEELQSFARCLRISELVGLNCIEHYLPHRVAMQFGMDQDLPASVARVTQTRDIAWTDYNKPIAYVNLYIPSRLFEADVTIQYLDWWKQSLSRVQAASQDVLDDPPPNRILPGLKITPRRSKGAKEKTPERAKRMKKGDSFSISKITKKRSKGTKKTNYNYIASFKITPKISDGVKQGEESLERSKWKEKDIDASLNLGSPLKKAKLSAKTLKEPTKVFFGSSSMIIKEEVIDVSIPPGFPPKSKLVEGSDSTEKDNLTIREFLKCSKKHNDVGSKQGCDDENLSGKSFSSSIADNKTLENIEKHTELVEKIMQNEAVKGRSKTTLKVATEGKTGHDVMEIQGGEEDFDKDLIEALLSGLERTAEELKACVARLNHRFTIGQPIN